MITPGRLVKGLPARLCLGLILLCVATAAKPAAVDPARTGFRQLETQVRVSWSDTAQMVLGGLPVSYRQFFSKDSPTVTAGKFAHDSGMFDQVLAFKDMVVLSGSRDGWHWVAEISTGARGTQGLVSAVRLEVSAVPDKTGLGMEKEPAWLPSGATLRFDQALPDGNVRVRQRLYVLPQPPLQAWPLLRSRLAAMGWSPVPDGRVMMETWKRQRSRLLLALVPESSGSALLTHLQE